VAVLLHYLYTASFMWMSAEGLHLYFKIVTVFNLQNLKFIYYVVFCWGSPIIVVGISAVTRTEGYGTGNTCWLSLDKGLIWSFVGPVAAIILFNLFMLGMTIKVLVSLTEVAESAAHKNSLRSCVKAALILMPLLGISWLFGLLSVNSGTIAFQYLFAIVNSSQARFNSNRYDTMINILPSRSCVKAALILMPLLGISWLFGLLSVNSGTIAFQYLFAIVNSSQGFFIFSFHCIGNTEVRAALVRLKKRHSVKVSTQNVSLEKMRTKSKVLKQSEDLGNPKTNIANVTESP
ncbi:adhesion G-protein coupled receptor D1-like, partial [Stylophora pistillata]|uniref:adhesion G-protein coupled receptor D1-like n=1 Tax=Stylophora pistillata TaxID=50429 RepID=UPI000C052B3D